MTTIIPFSGSEGTLVWLIELDCSLVWTQCDGLVYGLCCVLALNLHSLSLFLLRFLSMIRNMLNLSLCRFEWAALVSYAQPPARIAPSLACLCTAFTDRLHVTACDSYLRGSINGVLTFAKMWMLVNGSGGASGMREKVWRVGIRK